MGPNVKYLVKFLKINQTPDWSHFSCIKFLELKPIYKCALHERSALLKIQQPFKNSHFRHFLANKAATSIDSVKFNYIKFNLI